VKQQDQLLHPYRQREWLKEQYEVNGRTLQDIGNQFGVSKQRIQQLVKGFRLQKPNRSQYLAIDEEWLRKKYIIDRKTAKTLAVEKGVSVWTIRRALKVYGLKRHIFTPEERRKRGNLRQNHAYKTDPAYRAKKRANVDRWQREHL